jgi:hypothetical protein
LKDLVYSTGAKKKNEINTVWKPELKEFAKEKSRKHFNDMFNQHTSPDRPIDV